MNTRYANVNQKKIIIIIIIIRFYFEFSFTAMHTIKHGQLNTCENIEYYWVQTTHKLIKYNTIKINENTNRKYKNKISFTCITFQSAPKYMSEHNRVGVTSLVSFNAVENITA